jgi:DNA (cytosine-5)-methyltransferase 1
MSYVAVNAGYGHRVPGDVIRTVDLFAGAGGLTAGFHSASSRFQTVVAVEHDLAAAATFEANFGAGVTWAGSIESWLASAELPRGIDVIVGGPPCQGFSMLGKREESDERNLLWREYAEAVRRMEPKYFVVENVAAFGRSTQYLDFVAAVQKGGVLEHYDFEFRVLNAADYGAPQARKRAVLLGHHRDVAAPEFPVPTHADRHITVWEALRGLPWEPLPESKIERRITDFAGESYPGPFSGLDLHTSRRYSELSLRRFEVIPEGGSRHDLPRRLQADCWRDNHRGAGDVMGRLHWDRPAVTIRTEFFKPEKGRFLHPVAMRAITHWEAAIFQGFPDTFRFVGTRAAIARQIGNAVPVQLGTAIGRSILHALESDADTNMAAPTPCPTCSDGQAAGTATTSSTSSS